MNPLDTNIHEAAYEIPHEQAAVSRYSLRHFGKEHAHPTITHYYTVEGWVAQSDRRTRLTAESAQSFRERGIFMVRVRFKFRSRDVPLARYLDA